MVNKQYTVVVTDEIRKTILKLPTPIAVKIENSLLDLEEDPRPPGCKKLKGRRAYRIRVDDFKIVYEIADNILQVFIIDRDHKKDIYE